MKHLIMVSVVLFLAASPSAMGQLTVHPFTESFDRTDILPDGWAVSGFELSTSVPRSSPNCLLARGNMVVQTLITAAIDPTERALRTLSWYERRSGTAVPFVLIVYHESDSGRLMLSRFDSIDAANSYQERRVDLTVHLLPSSAPGRFVFEVQADSTSSSGVLRIDDVGLAADPRADLSLSIAPPDILPMVLGEAGTISSTVRNLRQRDAAGASIEVIISLTETSSHIERHIAILPLVPAGDSLVFRYPFATRKYGMHTASCTLHWPDDQDLSNDTASVSFAVRYAPRAAVITEFMFAPLREDEPEWIEIYNPGPNVIDGRNLTLSDKGTQHTIVSPTEFLIVPGEYVVISASSLLGDVHNLVGVRWQSARFSSLNNTSPDAVVLRDSYGFVLDSVAYDPSWGIPGTSLERRDWLLPSELSDTWLPSRSATGGTPGRVNSVQRSLLNGAIDSLVAIWVNERSAVSIHASIDNPGRNATPPGTLHILAASSIPVAEPRLVGSVPVGPLQPDAQSMLEYEWTPKDEGTITLVARLDIPGDMDRFDDTLTAAIDIPYAPASLVVNEIMFDPPPGECEWIELLNLRDVSIPLNRWTLTDLPTASGLRTMTVLDTAIILPPGGLAVIAGDSSLFARFSWLRTEPFRSRVLLLNRSNGLGLNASEDGIVLADPTGRTIDSTLYSAAWHNPSVDEEGRSLERLRTDIPGTEARTWSSAPGPVKASPGKPNLALPPIRQTASQLEIHPNPFSPDGDGYEEMAFVAYAYAIPSVFIKAIVFDDRGREVRMLADGGLYSGQDMLVWDGLDNSGRRVRRGPYILAMEVWNAQHGFSVSEKRVVVVAR